MNNSTSPIISSSSTTSTQGEVPTTPVVSKTSSRRKRGPVFVGLLISAGVIALGVIAFVIIHFLPASNPGGVKVTTVYVTPKDSEDPEADYLEYLESTKTDPESTLNATLSQFNFKMFGKKTDEAFTFLKTIDVSEYSDSPESLYKIYSAYAYYYSPGGVDDSASYEKYNALAEEQRKLLLQISH